MHHIIYIMGKSSSGKDTAFRRLLDELDVRPLVLYTTRPMRSNEQNGREYYFVDQAYFEKLYAEGDVIEKRVYHTVHGDWTYFTTAESIHLEEGNYLGIGTLESFVKLKAYFGDACVVPVYIDVEDGERLIRAIHREQSQKEPQYLEMCRRFIADSQDFSHENLQAAGIEHAFSNNCSMDDCIAEIKAYLQTI